MTADILFKNGHFWTGNPRIPFAEFVASQDGLISAIGGKAGLVIAVGAKQVVDLREHFVIPGFIDSHAHFRLGGASLRQINLRGTKTESEVFDSVKKYAESAEPGKWIVGGNWDHESWDSKRLPTKELIDKYTPSTPVFLNRYDTHTALVNSVVLKLAGIDRNTPDPPGGVIVRNDRGEPTGILKDAAREIALRLIPEPSADDLLDDARRAMKHANSLGVTSVNEIGPERDLTAYRKLKELGELTVRICQVLPLGDYPKLVESRIKIPSGDRWIQLGALKAFADGSLGSGTAWFFDPYNDDNGNRGISSESMSSGRLEKLAVDADKSHLQLAIHAIGDRAVSEVLDIFERIRKLNPPWDRRFRIEHVQHVRLQDLARMRKMSVIASVQPYHCIDDGRWALGKIGAERAKTSFAFRKMLEQSIVLAFGTDWPVAPLNPMDGISAAATRKTIDDKFPEGWVPEQRISIEQALRAYTSGSAYASYCEGNRGTLEPGKSTDMVVLSANPMVVPLDEIKDIKVLMTVVDGKIVYSDGEFSDRYGTTSD